MRTTLDIADDVLLAAKDYARRDKKTVGEVLSGWGRQVLSSPAMPAAGASINNENDSEIDRKFRALGLVTLPNREGVTGVTNELVNRIREAEGI